MFVEGHSLFSSDATHDCIAYAFVGLLTKLQVGVLTSHSVNCSSFPMAFGLHLFHEAFSHLSAC